MNRIKYVAARWLATTVTSLRSPDLSQVGTRVLMFHDINTDDSSSDLYSLPLSRFDSGLRAIAQWAAEHTRSFVQFSSVPRPGIAVTFDDGYKSTLTHAAPIFAALNIPFHIFLTQSYVAGVDERFLRPTDIRELCSIPGVSFGVHGVSHQRLTNLHPDQVRVEIQQSRDWLEQLIGKPVTSLSYPHGEFNSTVSTIVEECGVLSAACSRIGTFTNVKEALQIPRIDIWAQDRQHVFLQKTLGAWDRLLP